MNNKKNIFGIKIIITILVGLIINVSFADGVKEKCAFIELENKKIDNNDFIKNYIEKKYSPVSEGKIGKLNYSIKYNNDGKLVFKYGKNYEVESDEMHLQISKDKNHFYLWLKDGKRTRIIKDKEKILEHNLFIYSNEFKFDKSGEIVVLSDTTKGNGSYNLKYYTLDGKEKKVNSLWGSFSENIFYSNDFSKYYYVGFLDGKYIIVKNNKIIEKHNKIEDFSVSKDFSKYSFITENNEGKKIIIQNGKKIIEGDYINRLQYVGNSNILSYIKGEKIKVKYEDNKNIGQVEYTEVTSPFFSPEFKQILIVGNKEYGKFDEINYIKFSDDGKNIFFIGKKGKKSFLLKNGKIILKKDYIWGFDISSDGEKIFNYDVIEYGEYPNKKIVMDINGVKSKEYFLNDLYGNPGKFIKNTQNYNFEFKIVDKWGFIMSGPTRYIKGKYTCNLKEIYENQLKLSGKNLKINLKEKIDKIFKKISSKKAELVFNKIQKISKKIRENKKYKNLIDYLESKSYFKINK